MVKTLGLVKQPLGGQERFIIRHYRDLIVVWLKTDSISFRVIK